LSADQTQAHNGSCNTSQLKILLQKIEIQYEILPIAYFTAFGQQEQKRHHPERSMNNEAQLNSSTPTPLQIPAAPYWPGLRACTRETMIREPEFPMA